MGGRTTIERALAVGAACLAIACQESPAPARAPLIGGTVEDDPAIMLLVVGESGSPEVRVCTATVIGPYAVVTARHCVEGRDVADLHLFVTGNIDDAGTPIAATAVHAIESDDDPLGLTWIGHDVAVVYASSRLSPTPKRVSFDPPSVGEVVGIAGFGIYDPRTSALGVERHGDGRVVEALGNVLSVMGEGATACSGDSGGPVLDSSDHVVAVNSGTRVGCLAEPYYAASLAAAPLMVLRAVGFRAGCVDAEVCGDGRDNDCTGVVDDACGEPGEACASDLDCRGVCVAGTCATPCDATADCATGETCFGVCRGVPSSCGNGTINAGEQCDDGGFNGSFLSQCGYDCTTLGPRCGDDRLAPELERCDDGAHNGRPFFCPIGCRPPPDCGDGRTTALGCEDPQAVRAMCELDPCSDGDEACVIECVERGCARELCDAGAHVGEYGMCNTYCNGNSGGCGDGVREGPEACDDGRDNGRYGHCASGCGGLGPRCGDAIVQARFEECDDGNDVDDDGCDDECALPMPEPEPDASVEDAMPAEDAAIDAHADGMSPREDDDDGGCSVRDSARGGSEARGLALGILVALMLRRRRRATLRP